MIRSNNQSRATLWVLEDVSHCRTSAFNDHLELQLHCPQTDTIKLLGAWIGHLKEQNQCLSSHRFDYETCSVFVHHSQVSPYRSETREIFRKNRNKQLNPIVPERANHLISIPCPERESQILLSCEKQHVCFLHIQLIGSNV